MRGAFVGIVLMMSGLWSGQQTLPARPPPRPAPQARLQRTAAAPVLHSGKWGPILQCESSGDWHISEGLFEGGLQFHPETWDAFKPEGFPDAAYDATPEQQMLVAERVLAAQGWKAWPACSKRVGYR